MSIRSFSPISFLWCGVHIRHQFPTKYTIRQDDKYWTLQEVEEERDLGIVTTADFKVSRQCGEAASKANKVFGMVSRQFKDLDKEGFLIIYKGYVRPHLEYRMPYKLSHYT